MGSIISAEEVKQIHENILLKRLSGSEAISDNDPYWNKLFSFNFNISYTDRYIFIFNLKLYFRLKQRDLSANINEFLQLLLYNTASTNNFSALIQVFLRRCNELDASITCKKYIFCQKNNFFSKIFLWQLANALLIIRHICVFFAQRLSDIEFIKIFETQTNLSKIALHNDDLENPIGDSLANELLRAEQLGEDFGNTAEAFLGALVDILIEVPIK